MEQIYNYIKVAIRSLFKFRSDAVLNVIGLSIGITISIIVFMYIRYELAYDCSYAKSSRTFRAYTKATVGNNQIESALSPMPMSDFLRNEFSEVETSVKIVRGANKLIAYEDKKFNEDNFFYADSSFFSVFDVPFVLGSANASLEKDEDVVITTTIAEKYFGIENPIGKKLELDNKLVFFVSGVCKPLPTNSHFHFDFIASQQSIKKLYIGKNHNSSQHFKDNWLKIDWYTYLVLKNNTNLKAFKNKFSSKLRKNVQNQISEMAEQNDSAAMGIKTLTFDLQPLEDIHLHSKLDNELEPNSKHLYVVLFLVLAIFVLLITCINFMNLTTARASLRIKEIGVRKLIGVNRKSLIIQFLTEAIIYSFVALFIALVLTELLLPGFNSLFNLELKLDRIEGRFDLLYIILITFLVGIISGIFPAISFSKRKEVSIHEDTSKTQKTGFNIRGILTATQMMVVTFITILTLAMLWQLQYLKNKNLGFNSRNIVVVERGYSIGGKFDTFKKVLKSIPGVIEVSACATLPGKEMSTTAFNYSGKNGDKLAMLPVNYIEKDFFKTLELKLDAGSIWDKNQHKKKANEVVISQKAKSFLEMNKPLGQRISFAGDGNMEFSVHGVVKDFHFEPIQLPMKPLILMDIHKEGYYENLLIKLSPKINQEETIINIKNKWDFFY